MLLEAPGSEQKAIRLADLTVAIQQNGEACLCRAYAIATLNEMQGAIADPNQAIAIKSDKSAIHFNRGTDRSDLVDKKGAVDDLTKAIEITPDNIET